MSSFQDPKLREKVISDLEKTITQQERQLNDNRRKQFPSSTKKSSANNNEEDYDEFLTEKHHHHHHRREHTNDNKNKKKLDDDSAISSFTTSIRKWKASSLVFKIVNTLSGWFLLAVLLFLMSWARHSMEPLSHLVGFQLIVTDVSIIDGDTFRAKIFPELTEAKFKLRLIDAPEMDQPFGFEASEILSQILTGNIHNHNNNNNKRGSALSPNSRISSTTTRFQHPSSREIIVSVIGLDDRSQRFVGGSSSFVPRKNKNKKSSSSSSSSSSSTPSPTAIAGLPVGGGKGGLVYYCDVVVRDSVFLNTSSVQRLMVERGAAWAFRGFHSQKRPSSLVLAMEEAQKKRIGLWKHLDDDDDHHDVEGKKVEKKRKVVPPWEYNSVLKTKQQQNAGGESEEDVKSKVIR